MIGGSSRAALRDQGQLLRVSRFCPPVRAAVGRGQEIRAKLASIGIGPGKTFAFKDPSLEHKAAMGLGMKEGDDKVDKYLASGSKNVNCWCARLRRRSTYL